MTVVAGKSMRSRVRPKISDCRIPVPAARVTAARKGPGMAARRVCICSVVIGTTRRTRSSLGNLVVAQGFALIFRSSTAAAMMLKRMEWTTPAVDGASGLT